VAGLSARGWIVAGLMFLVAAVSLAGLPPLSGFLGKLALLDATREHPEIWLALLLSSFIILLGLARAGTRVFWKQAPSASEVARRQSEVPGRRLEVAATVLLLGYGVAIAIAAAPLLAYTQAAAAQLAAPAQYLDHVRAQTPTLRTP